MANRLRKAILDGIWSALVTGVLLVAAGVGNAAVIAPGTPTITVPANITLTLGPDQFLLPVQVTGAVDLQLWQFDLTFNNTVVKEVDPGDGSSGIYGAEFTPGNASTSAFILGGFPDNLLGLVDDVAGSYPGLLSGPSGDGVLAYILFEYLPTRPTNDPGFGIRDTPGQQAPEPGTSILLAAALLTLSLLQRARGGRRGTMPR